MSNQTFPAMLFLTPQSQKVILSALPLLGPLERGEGNREFKDFCKIATLPTPFQNKYAFVSLFK